MQFTQVPNLRVEDFDSEKTWIGRLFIQLNPFIQSVNQMFNQNIDFTNNIKSMSRDFTISTFQPLSFTWSYQGTTPIDLRVVKATKGSSQTPTILQAAWSYSATTNTITVNRIVELTDTAVITLSGQYNFTIRVTV